MTSVREISRQGQTVPTEHPNVTDHLRMLAREINGLVPHKAIHPVDTPATISATYTMVDSDSLLLCKADNAITIHLLTAAGREGRLLTIKKIDAGATPIIIDAKDSETIDNAATATLTAQYSFLTIKSDNTNWWSVAQRADVGAGGGSGAPTDAQYVTLSNNGTLSAERVLTGSSTVSVTDSGANGTATLAVPDSSITEAKQVLADNTTQDVSTTKHGYVPKAPNDTTKYLRGDGTWATVSGGGGLSFNGARVKKAADQTAANYTAGAVVAWDHEVFDVGGWHDNATNNSRLTVPSGVSYAEFTACVSVENDTADRAHTLYLHKNGALYLRLGRNQEGSAAQHSMAWSSGPVPVSAGDYFEVLYVTESDTSIDVESDDSFFAVQAIG